MDERELIEGCLHKKAWACRELYELYAPAMMGVCVRYIGNRETAKDVLQEGFVKVFTKINTYEGRGSFAGWVRRIFVTSALEHLRLNKKDYYIQNIDYELENWHFGYTDTSMVEKLSAEELSNCITALPKGYRTIFNLFAIEGYSHSEIAKILNIKEVTSRTQFIRARKILQETILSLLEDQKHNEYKRK